MSDISFLPVPPAAMPPGEPFAGETPPPPEVQLGWSSGVEAVEGVGMLTRLGPVVWLGLALGAVLVAGFSGRAGDAPNVASGDGPQPPGPKPTGGTGQQSTGEPEASPEPDPSAAGAGKGADGGVPPPPSRAAEYVRRGTPELDEQVTKVRAARESGDPVLKEALRGEEIEQLRSDIANLNQTITDTREPLRGEMIWRLARAMERLKELGETP